MKMFKKRSILLVASLFIFGCGDKNQAGTEQVKNFQCESVFVQGKLIADFSEKLIEEGAKGYAAQSMRDILSIKDIVRVSKDDKGLNLRCNAQISVKYPPDISEKFANVFSSEKSLNDFKERLEETYGIVNGGGYFAQLIDAISDGPFGHVPSVMDLSKFNKYKTVIQKNLEALIAEQLEIDITYELKPDVGSGFDSGHPMVKWQINKRDVLDINTSLISINSVL